MKPVIGILARVEQNRRGTSLSSVIERYRQVIIQKGGNPFLILPPQTIDYVTTRLQDIPPLSKDEEEMITFWLDKCDGVILPGGHKKNPISNFILDYVTEKDMPILGICLGMQEMSRYKNPLPLEANSNIEVDHNQPTCDYVHKVKVSTSSKLYQILNETELEVNSIHQYHVSENKYYKVSAVASDGLIEALERIDQTFHIGVQWHPEKMVSYDQNANKLIDAFMIETKNYHKRKTDITCH